MRGSDWGSDRSDERDCPLSLWNDGQSDPLPSKRLGICSRPDRFG